jgi:hypothetical protein
MKLKDKVEEVRAARHAYAARFNYDLAEMYKDLKTKERSGTHPIADLAPANREPATKERKEESTR